MSDTTNGPSGSDSEQPQPPGGSAPPPPPPPPSPGPSVPPSSPPSGSDAPTQPAQPSQPAQPTDPTADPSPESQAPTQPAPPTQSIPPSPEQPLSSVPTEPVTPPAGPPPGSFPGAPMPSPPAGGPPPGSFGTMPPPPADGGALPSYVGSGDAATPKKGRGKAIGLAIGAVAIVGGGLFALTSLMKDDGASGPGDAVAEMFDAIDNDDILGVLDSLPPGERDALKDPFVDITDELKRLGILADDTNLESVGGIDITVEGLETETEEVGEGVARVTITGGAVSVAIDGDEVPVGDVLTDLIEKSGGQVEIPSITDTGDLADAGIELIAIEEDGGWHVSFAYSIAEAIRRDSGMPAPDFGNGVDPVGADSPEGAIEGMLDAVTELDLARIIGHTDPGELRVLYDYAPLFLDEAQSALDQIRQQADLEVEVTDVELDSSGGGDTREVAIKGIDIGFTSGEMNGSVGLADGCVTVDIAGLEDPFADMGVAGNQLCQDDVGEESPFGTFEMASSGIVVVEHDGKWFVSPTRTIGAGIVGFLQSIDRDALEEADSFLDAFFGDLAPLLTGSELGGFEDSFDDTFDEDFGIETPTTLPGGVDIQEGIPAPTGFEALDELAGLCESGVMGACDDLFLEADFDDPAQKPYSDFGITCGGRVSADVSDRGSESCEDLLGETAD